MEIQTIVPINSHYFCDTIKMQKSNKGINLLTKDIFQPHAGESRQHGSNSTQPVQLRYEPTSEYKVIIRKELSHFRTRLFVWSSYGYKS